MRSLFGAPLPGMGAFAGGLVPYHANNFQQVDKADDRRTSSVFISEFINQQKMAKDTAGGIVEAHVFGCPIGLGSFMTWDGRLDGRDRRDPHHLAPARR